MIFTEITSHSSVLTQRLSTALQRMRSNFRRSRGPMWVTIVLPWHHHHFAALAARRVHDGMWCKACGELSILHPQERALRRVFFAEHIAVVTCRRW
ncbi:MAG: hypothetical protein ACR2OL_02275, partial [Anderseniella sp.]